MKKSDAGSGSGKKLFTEEEVRAMVAQALTDQGLY